MLTCLCGEVVLEGLHHNQQHNSFQCLLMRIRPQHAALAERAKTRNQDNASGWTDMSTRGPFSELVL
jgi:hypothetical protein